METNGTGKNAEAQDTGQIRNGTYEILRNRLAGHGKDLRDRIEKLNDYEKYSAPSRKGPYFFFSKNEGLQNQSVLYTLDRLDGTRPRVLIDPNKWSKDGTAAIAGLSVSATSAGSR